MAAAADELPNDIESLLALSESGNHKATLHCAFYYESVNDIENANKYFELSADAGFPDAQFFMGYRLENGINVAIDLPRANKYYRLSADSGNGDAQFRLSKNLREGNGIDKDEAEADRYFQLAKESHERATIEVLPTDFDELKALADEQHSAKAMLLVAFHLETRSDFENANKYYRASADAGNADAQFLMGLRLENGINVEKDCEQALKYYRLSAQNGNGDAQSRLRQLEVPEMKQDPFEGLPSALDELLELGKTGNTFAELRAAIQLDEQQKFDEANAHFKRSADAGNANAQLLYGLRLAYGINTVSDVELANDYYRRSAVSGNEDAIFRLALNLQNGNGIPADLDQANYFLKMSADRGNRDAQVAFAMNLQNGNGVDVNEEEAKRYLDLAKREK